MPRPREDWMIRDEALDLYRTTELTPVEVAQRFGLDPAIVEEWIRKNGRLRGIHRSKHTEQLRARRLRVIELAANGVDYDTIARMMGLSDRANIRRLLRKSLEELSAELRDQKAWEKAKIQYSARLEALYLDWREKGTGPDADPRFAALALQALVRIGRASAFETVTIHTVNENVPAAVSSGEEDISSIMNDLEILASRRVSPVIEGELAAEAPQPGGELPGE